VHFKEYLAIKILKFTFEYGVLRILRKSEKCFQKITEETEKKEQLIILAE
jgi:hypothetical protein